MYSWAIPYRNPFALIQKRPDKWQGLVGNVNGKLQFQNDVYGARAGYINLFNTYINRGLNTPAKIFPVYAPKGHGANDPQKYIFLIEKIVGIKANEPINTMQKFYDLGRGITQVERGKVLNAYSLGEGYKLASQALGPKMKEGILKANGQTSKALLPVLATFLGLGFIMNQK